MNFYVRMLLGDNMSRLMIFIIKIYKSIPSNIHNACRFTPTCSTYAIQAYENYGFFKGTFLTIKRLLRCTPFGSYGYDPVEIRRKNEKNT